MKRNPTKTKSLTRSYNRSFIRQANKKRIVQPMKAAGTGRKK